MDQVGREQSISLEMCDRVDGGDTIFDSIVDPRQIGHSMRPTEEYKYTLDPSMVSTEFPAIEQLPSQHPYQYLDIPLARVNDTVVQFSSLVLIGHYRNFRQLKEWRDFSNTELVKIRERPLAQPNFSIVSNNDGGVQFIVREKGEVLGADHVLIKGRALLERKTLADYSYSVISSETSEISKLPNVDSSNATLNATVNLDQPITQLDASASAPADALSQIRARQQRLHNDTFKSFQQGKREQRNRRERAILVSMRHDAANRAHQVRIKQILREEELLSSNHSENQFQGRDRSRSEELYEMERAALLQQQDLDYGISLQHDRERARVLESKREKMKMRQEALNDAKYRLVKSGAHLFGLLDELEFELSKLPDYLNSVGDGNSKNTDETLKIQVRLLLPSGQRLQGKFSDSHLMGLIYDFALVALERANLLFHQEESTLETESLIRFDCSPYSDSVEYDCIKDGWNKCFFSFSVASTYPQRTYDNLEISIGQSGLNQNSMLLVVFEDPIET